MGRLFLLKEKRNRGYQPHKARRSIGRATPFQAGVFQGIMAGLSLPPPSDKLLARETSPPRLDGCTLGYDWAL